MGQTAKAFPKTSSLLFVLFSLGDPRCIIPSMQASRFERQEGDRDSLVDQHPLISLKGVPPPCLLF